MWREILDFAKQIFALAQKVDSHDETLKELQRDNRQLRDEFSQLTTLVQKLIFEIERVSEREQQEREKMALQLTIKFLNLSAACHLAPRNNRLYRI